jgi:hypothetical protein
MDQQSPGGEYGQRVAFGQDRREDAEKYHYDEASAPSQTGDR